MADLQLRPLVSKSEVLNVTSVQASNPKSDCTKRLRSNRTPYAKLTYFIAECSPVSKVIIQRPANLLNGLAVQIKDAEFRYNLRFVHKGFQTFASCTKCVGIS